MPFEYRADTTTEITVTKDWLDGNNADGARPGYIEIDLYEDGYYKGKYIYLSDANNWTGTFTDLPVGPNYTVEEQNISGYTQTGAFYSGSNVTITNTELTSVPVYKVWDDGGNASNRPSSITVNLYANGTHADSLTLTGPNWTGSFDNLLKYDSSNRLISYTIDEDVPDGYVMSISGNTITNRAEVEVPVEKVWDDNNNAAGKRPSSIVVELYANGSRTNESLVLSESNGWYNTFTGLDKYDSNGNEISYTVEEQTPEGYKATISGNQFGYTITNRIGKDITVTKRWEDGNNADGIRPGSVTVQLSANGSTSIRDMNGNSVSSTAVLSAANNWQYSWTDLAAYDSSGNIINYTVSENPVPGGYAADYSEQGSNSLVITNTELVDIPVNKTWLDANNKDNIRPASVTISLYKDGVKADSLTLSRNNNWQGTFSNLPKYENGKFISYTIKEDTVSGYRTAISGYSVTNTALINVPVRKAWEDSNNKAGARPDSITVVLYKNGVRTNNTLTLSSSNNWQGTFTDLVRYDDAGQDFVYTVEEEAVPNGYKVIMSGSTTTGYNITNIAAVDVPVEKKWEDGNNADNARPTSVAATLYAGGTKVTKDVRGNSIANPATLSASNNWKYEWKDLPTFDSNGNYIAYTVKEEIVPTHYKVDYSGTVSDGLTILNTELINLPVEKIWKDGNNTDKVRPASVTIHLYADGVDTGKTLTLSSSNGWKGTFGELPKYQNGKRVAYTVKEDDIEHYINAITSAENGKFELLFTVKNTEVYTDVYVSKLWEDYDNQNGKRPGEVVVYLDANGVYTGKSITINNDTNWKGSFKKIPKYDDDNKLITYTVREKEIKDNQNELKYLLTSNKELDTKNVFTLAFELTNTELINIGGIVWVDNPQGKQETVNNQLDTNDTRMAGVAVRLYRDGQLITASADGKIQYTGGINYTNGNGQYQYTRVLITGTYNIEFEYGGQEHTPVRLYPLNSGAPDYRDNPEYTNIRSAASEKAAEREALNSKFGQIIKGTAKYKDGANTVALEYDRNAEEHTSTINRNTSEFKTKSAIKAYTASFKGNARYIGYINLGLIKRAQVNIGVMSDVNDVELVINGQSHKYDYSERDEKTAVEITAKVGDLGRVYNQALYKSDYNFRIDAYKNSEKNDPIEINDTSRELEAYITYKIKVKNYSSQTAEVSELKVYYDESFEYVDFWYTDTDNTIRNSATSLYSLGAKQNGYNTMTISALKDTTLVPDADEYIYVRFRVLKDEDRNIRTGTKYIVTEITGYTTAEGLIDMNSEPGNLDTSNLWESYISSMEDDTDRAPGLNLYVDDNLERTATGFVFEDDADKLDSDGVKVGDGIYDGNANKLKDNVVVQLIELVKIGNNQYEHIWNEMITGRNELSYIGVKDGRLYARNITPSKGTYTFKGYVPGNYIVRFRYGEIIVDNVVILSGQDYKSTENKGFGDNTSSAYDNSARRWDTMQYSAEQSYEKAMILKNEGANPTALKENTWMYADTANFAVGIAEDTPATRINFGVVKRPISELDVQKTISRIRITNGGIVLADTDQKFHATLEGTNKEPFIEVDNELINSAIMEITYNIQITNTGEKDTLWNYFRGETLGGKVTGNQHEETTTAATLLFDYPQKIGIGNSDTWVAAENGDISLLSSEVQANITGDRMLLVLKPNSNSNALYKAIKSGEATEPVAITLSRVLAEGQNDDLIFNNMVEIVRSKNTVGRRAEQSIHGNYKPSLTDSIRVETNESILEPDESATTTVVTNPTGSKYNPHYEIWIASGAILIIGIALIKVFVLRKKK